MTLTFLLWLGTYQVFTIPAEFRSRQTLTVLGKGFEHMVQCAKCAKNSLVGPITDWLVAE